LEQGEELVDSKRTLQLLDTGATTIVRACPFCMTMLTDGLKNQDKDEAIGPRDIAEILADVIELDEVEEIPVAAQLDLHAFLAAVDTRPPSNDARRACPRPSFYMQRFTIRVPGSTASSNPSSGR